MKIFSLASTRILGIAALLYLVQVFPYTGILLMFAGGPFWVGLLIELYFVVLFFEARSGKIPRWLMAVPVLALAAYYGVFAWQRLVEIPGVEAQLRRDNSRLVLRYDPARYALVDADLAHDLDRVAVPVIYAPAPQSVTGFTANRWLSAGQCAGAQHLDFGLNTTSGPRDTCFLEIQETPRKDRLAVTRQGNARLETAWLRAEQLTEIRLNGRLLGRHRIVAIGRLFAFPLLLAGCVLIDNPSEWRCSAGFMYSTVTLDGRPAGAPPEDAQPEVAMLGLPLWTSSQRDGFQGFAENDAAVRVLHGGPSAQMAALVAGTLRRILAGEDFRVPDYMLPWVGRAPDTLAPMAGALARRLADMSVAVAGASAACVQATLPTATPLAQRDGIGWLALAQMPQTDQRDYRQCLARRPQPRWSREQMRILGNALAALPPAAYAPQAGLIADMMGLPDMTELHPALYIRSADAGRRLLPRFARDFQVHELRPANALLPALALCRLGEADAATRAEMKTRFLAGDEPGLHADDPHYGAALVMALVRLHETAFIAANRAAAIAKLQQDDHAITTATAGDRLEAWLAGRQWSAVGPGNCMTHAFTREVKLPPAMWPLP